MLGGKLFNDMTYYLKSKKFLMINVLFIVVMFLLLSGGYVFADPPGGPIDCTTPPLDPACGQLQNPLGTTNTFAGLMNSIAGSIARIGLPIAAIFIIYSGLLFVTARGSDEQIKKARNAFMWAVIGTGVLLGAWVIAAAIDSTVRSLGT